MRNDASFQMWLERSRVYERAFADYLQTRGHYILPAYDYNGQSDNKAPRLVCGKHWLVTPDLLSVRAQQITWFEIKLRGKADLHRKTNTLVTGIPLRNWNDYRRVKALMDTPIYIVFVHEKENTVFVDELDTLPESHRHDGDVPYRGGTIFFRFNDLKPHMSLDALRFFVKDSP